MRLPALFCWLAFLAACSKTSTKDDDVYGEPVGIEVNGDLTVAVAVERGRDLDTAVVPELATLLARAAKDCPDLHELEGGAVVSLRVAAKDGVLSTQPSPLDSKSKCLARALDGQTAGKLGTIKLLLQVGVTHPKEAK